MGSDLRQKYQETCLRLLITLIQKKGLGEEKKKNNPVKTKHLLFVKVNELY